MSKCQPRKKGSRESKAQVAMRRMYTRMVWLVLVFAAIVAGAFFLLHGKQTSAKSPGPPATK